MEEQLEQLNKRRLEIEGKIEDVARNTEVGEPQKISCATDGIVSFLKALFPNSKGEVESMPPLENWDESGNDDSSSSSSSGAGGVPKSLISKILKKEEETPLTTKAYKDLQKAQKARIYSKTLIRVK